MKKKEFEKSLQTPLAFWQEKTKEEVCFLLGREASDMVGFEQRNPHHCYDLFLHTLYTVKGLPENCSPLLRTAAFFHDIGKTITAKEKNGRLVFHGHAAKSAEIAGKILKEMGYGEGDTRRILFYISHHDDFVSWCLPEEYEDGKGMTVISRENVRRKKEQLIQDNTEVFREVPEAFVWSELVALLLADLSAQAEYVYLHGKLVDSREHKERKAREIGRYIQEPYYNV